MPAPSPLVIATQSVSRLVKEEAYYRKELEGQNKQVAEEQAKLSADTNYNDKFMLKQLETAVRETEAVFGPLLTKVEDAVGKLEEQMAISESSGGASDDELKKAREALAAGRALAQKGDATESKAAE
ncbi:hypothetical protein MAPG_04054 [Magnaporthiopsis poae ATCC 64411]|uniref:Tubulin-specific chaperone A n=1 Tax=Magnaporthiopsis poae (strain ATCC 64411 / 73-15) TaxID=644358 RepID=A0A0C4DVP5_MAGP6|nr:hypothetical protein MAPG_04054 [Magnaporthiopsis poae ATCC 64411]